jgi:hypothetical protein
MNSIQNQIIAPEPAISAASANNNFLCVRQEIRCLIELVSSVLTMPFDALPNIITLVMSSFSIVIKVIRSTLSYIFPHTDPQVIYKLIEDSKLKITQLRIENQEKKNKLRNALNIVSLKKAQYQSIKSSIQITRSYIARLQHKQDLLEAKNRLISQEISQLSISLESENQKTSRLNLNVQKVNTALRQIQQSIDQLRTPPLDEETRTALNLEYNLKLNNLYRGIIERFPQLSFSTTSSQKLLKNKLSYIDALGSSLKSIAGTRFDYEISPMILTNVSLEKIKQTFFESEILKMVIEIKKDRNQT